MTAQHPQLPAAIFRRRFLGAFLRSAYGQDRQRDEENGVGISWSSHDSVLCGSGCRVK